MSSHIQCSNNKIKINKIITKRDKQKILVNILFSLEFMIVLIIYFWK